MGLENLWRSKWQAGQAGIPWALVSFPTHSQCWKFCMEHGCNLDKYPEAWKVEWKYLELASLVNWYMLVRHFQSWKIFCKCQVVLIINMKEDPACRRRCTQFTCAHMNHLLVMLWVLTLQAWGQNSVNGWSWRGRQEESESLFASV